MTTFQELIQSTSDGDYWQAKERNEDLTTLAKSVAMVVESIGLERAAVVLKESIICAYLLGRRDAVKIPDIFKDT